MHAANPGGTREAYSASYLDLRLSPTFSRFPRFPSRSGMNSAPLSNALTSLPPPAACVRTDNLLRCPLRMDETIAPYRRLDSKRIVETVKTLRARVEERFPGSGLSRVVSE